MFVTHDQEEALPISDRIAVVSGGRIEQIGTTTEIYHAPATAFVARFIGMANIFAATVLGEEAGMLRLGLGGGCRVERPGGRIGVGTGNDRTPCVQSRCIGKASGILARASLRRRWWRSILRGRPAGDACGRRTARGVELMVIGANESASEEAFYQGERVCCGANPQEIVEVRGEQRAG